MLVQVGPIEYYFLRSHIKSNLFLFCPKRLIKTKKTSLIMSEEFSPQLRVALLCLSMLIGFISLLSSLAIMLMILKSKIKLSVPYRRIIFGLSVYDVIYSFSHVVAWFAHPSTDEVWGTIGNQLTCSMQGCIKFIGATGSQMYNGSLCTYFACAIVLSMKQSSIEKRVEPFLHIFPVLWTLIGAIYLSVNKYFNITTDNITCGIQSYPLDCVHDENIPCEQGENFMKVKWILLIIPLLLTSLLIIVTMTLIYLTVKKQERKMKKYTFKIRSKEQHKKNCHIVCDIAVSSHAELPEEDSQNYDVKSRHRNITMLQHTRKIVSRSIHSVLSTQSKKTRDVFIQSMLYACAFVFTWIFQFLKFMARARGRPSHILTIGGKICKPAQGCLNVLVYTRQSVICLRKAHSDYSWWKAFVTVIKTGGDNDGNFSQKSLNRRSLVLQNDNSDN